MNRPTDRPTDRPTSGSLFSGIGGFDLGMERAGFDIRWQVEINADCAVVLSRHWPHVQRHGDINAMVYGKHRNRRTHGLVLEPVDVIFGGFPCQDVSVAGKRLGLSGSRSGLFFAFMRAVRLLKPKVVVLENVPGLLSTQRGRDFHTVLSEMAQCGLRRAYRILDSQYFGIPQRRRRVFVVGCAREFDISPGAILFESIGRDRHSTSRQSAGSRPAATLRGRSHRAGVNAPGRGGEDDVNLIAFDNRNGKTPDEDVCGTLRAASHGANPMIAATLNSGGNTGGFRTEPGEHLIAAGERARALVGSMHKRHDDDTDTLIPVVGATLGANTGRNHLEQDYIPFDTTQITSKTNRSLPKAGDPCHPLSATSHPPAIAAPITASAGHHGHSSPRGDGRDNLVFSLGSHAGAANGDATNHSHHSGGPVGFGITEEQSNSLRAGRPSAIGGASSGVRRLTPLECERLQGFPDGWTCLCGEGHRGTQFCSCDDTYRYKGLGNAVSVPVAEWIGHRLKAAMETNGPRRT